VQKTKLHFPDVVLSIIMSGQHHSKAINQENPSYSSLKA
jgi:hypothetical protein